LHDSAGVRLHCHDFRLHDNAGVRLHCHDFQLHAMPGYISNNANNDNNTLSLLPASSCAYHIPVPAGHPTSPSPRLFRLIEEGEEVQRTQCSENIVSYTRRIVYTRQAMPNPGNTLTSDISSLGLFVSYHFYLHSSVHLHFPVLPND